MKARKPKTDQAPLPAPIEWTRADPAELAKFDPASKVCTMNCGPHRLDPRTRAERMYLCDDCVTDRKWAKANAETGTLVWGADA